MLLSTALPAEVRLPAIFSDHMVLQAAPDTPVWGTAAPAESVRVTLGDGIVSGETTADAEGHWLLHLDLSTAAAGPHRMQVRGSNTIDINDVVIGQVWLAGGQSNMAFRLSDAIGAQKEIAEPARIWLREFKVRHDTAVVPRNDVSGKWVVGTQQAVGNFSAVGYFFALSIHERLQQPVGIICSNLGATPIEPWTSLQALQSNAGLAAGVARRDREINDMPARRAAYIKALSTWTKANGTEDAVFMPAAAFAATDVDTSGWTSVQLNGSHEISGKGLPSQGVIWLRRDVQIPQQAAGRPLSYRIQAPYGLASYYWNGDRIDGPASWQSGDMDGLEGVGAYRVLSIATDKVKAGRNVLAVRIYAPTHAPRNGGGRHDIRGAARFSMQMGGNVSAWLAKAEATFNPSAEALTHAPRLFPAPAPEVQQPARLFNTMIAPIARYGIAGVIWYQGESNVARAKQYREAFPLLIRDWRAHWGNSELPFYFCQLANYQRKQSDPGESSWAELREAQSAALELPHTGQAVLIDVGEAVDIHPRDKRTPGERLARLALRHTYADKSLIASGPVYERQTLNGSTVYLHFQDAGNGSELVAGSLPQRYPLKSLNNTSQKLDILRPDSQLQGFAICGEDGKWVWADARIDGTHSVAVSSPEVPHPVAVRYAWADNPTCNLYNSAGLPASPFRTDTFPLITTSGRY